MARSGEYPITPEEIINPGPLDIAQLKTKLGLTTQEFASATNRSVRSAARWLAEDSAQPAGGETGRAVRRLAHLQFLLADVVGAERSAGWLRTPNRGFRGEAPIDLLTSGRIESVIAVLETLADGSPT